MAFVDRIRECRAHDLGRFLPFLIENQRAGWIRRDIGEVLVEHAAVFEPADGAIRMAPGLTGFEARSEAVHEVVLDLAARGVMRLLGDEWYAVAPRFGAEPWLRMQRSALPAFGARAYGVHMHGVVRRPDGTHLWIARRSRGKTTFPGMLDNMVAGGQPLGLGVSENLVKECAEEAAIPAELARAARPTGVVAYRVEHEWGLRNDTLFLYELELPADFVPRNTDGEVERFELWPVERVMETVATSARFKFNCNLAILDFLVRHGHLGPEHPEYLDVLQGLHGADW